MVQVALIYAKSPRLRGQAAEQMEANPQGSGVYARDEIYPPLGITLLAAWLERAGHRVRLFDDSLDDERSLRGGMQWADVVGISSLTANARRARELGRMARQEYGRMVVMGGPHPTTNPEFFLCSGAADVCVQGEGDLTLPAWLEVREDRAAWHGVEGIQFLEDGAPVATSRRALFKDMDSMPLPAYHLWDLRRYMQTMVTPGLMISSSRGCPYACTFCDAEMTPRQYRSMSPERTVDEVQHLLESFQVPLLIFNDDLFTIQRKRVIAICKEILRRGLVFEWIAESRVDTMDYELLRWMKRAGCTKVGYGLESGSPRMLATMKKGVTLERIHAGARLSRELGMFFKFFVLYGFPEDTPEDYRLTEELVALTRPDLICCSILQPIPGTAVYEQLKPQLLVDLAEVDFHFWYGTESFVHPSLTGAQIREARERLQRVHERATRGLWPRTRRRLERARAMLRHPELVADWLEARVRRRRVRRSLARGPWAEHATSVEPGARRLAMSGGG